MEVSAAATMLATSTMFGCPKSTPLPNLPIAAATCPAHGCCANAAPRAACARSQLSHNARLTRLPPSPERYVEVVTQVCAYKARRSGRVYLGLGFFSWTLKPIHPWYPLECDGSWNETTGSCD